jgi:DMSO/TMAO reductase YedYZ molybdopterin-dependent catalytic subunit
MKRLSAILLLFLFSALAFAQKPAPLLTINGAGVTPLTITADDWAKLPRASVTAPKGHEGTPAQFEGVPLKLLLQKAGVLDPEKELRGKKLLQYVIVSAKDGYRVLFSIGELDPATGANSNALLADKVDGKPLDEHSAPLQLVIPSDKRPARSVRMVTTITVSSAE